MHNIYFNKQAIGGKDLRPFNMTFNMNCIIWAFFFLSLCPCLVQVLPSGTLLADRQLEWRRRAR